jgi:transposase-like protein
MNIISIFEQFPREEDCIKHLEKVRWNGKPVCPYCESTNSTPIPIESRHHCNTCKTAFSVTVRTIFHHTHLPLQKWLLAVSLILNAKKGISSRQLSRDLQVNKDTAWRISMKIREAMNERWQRDLLTGIVEADETYIGGKPRKGDPNDNNHTRGRGTKKTPVIGMVERGGKVKAESSFNKPLNIKNLSALVRRNVDIKNSVLMTDEYSGYLGVNNFMPHKTIDHQVWYVDGDIHTNTIESFWAILKRGIVGQFHKVSVKHLPKYLDEFCYRYNYRKNGLVFDQTIQRALGV